MPLLDRRYVDEMFNDYVPIWRRCEGELYVTTDRGAGTIESPLDWDTEVWKVECEMGHVLLLPYDDTNGPVVRLEEAATQPHNHIAIGMESLIEALASLPPLMDEMHG